MEERAQRGTQSIGRNITGKHFINHFYYFIRFILLKLSYLINNHLTIISSLLVQILIYHYHNKLVNFNWNGYRYLFITMNGVHYNTIRSAHDSN